MVSGAATLKCACTNADADGEYLLYSFAQCVAIPRLTCQVQATLLFGVANKLAINQLIGWNISRNLTARPYRHRSVECDMPCSLHALELVTTSCSE